MAKILDLQKLEAERDESGNVPPQSYSSCLIDSCSIYF